MTLTKQLDPSVTVAFRLTLEDYNHFMRIVNKSGFTISEFLRDLVNREVLKKMMEQDE